MRFVATCKAPPRPHRARASSSKTTTGAASQAALPGSLAASDSRSAPGRRVLRSVQTDPYPKRSPPAPVSLRPTGQTDDQMRTDVPCYLSRRLPWLPGSLHILKIRRTIRNCAGCKLLTYECQFSEFCARSALQMASSVESLRFAMGPLGTLHASAIGDQGNNGVTVSGLDARGLDPRLLARKDNSCPKSHQYTACRSPIAALKGRPSSFLAVCLRAKERRRSPVFDFLGPGGARGVRRLTQPSSLLRRGPRLQPPMAHAI